MTIAKAISSTDGRDLILKCTIQAPPENVFEAWTNPDALSAARPRPIPKTASQHSEETQ